MSRSDWRVVCRRVSGRGVWVVSWCEGFPQGGEAGIGGEEGFEVFGESAEVRGADIEGFRTVPFGEVFGTEKAKGAQFLGFPVEIQFEGAVILADGPMDESGREVAALFRKARTAGLAAAAREKRAVPVAAQGADDAGDFQATGHFFAREGGDGAEDASFERIRAQDSTGPVDAGGGTDVRDLEAGPALEEVPPVCPADDLPGDGRHDRRGDGAVLDGDGPGFGVPSPERDFGGLLRVRKKNLHPLQGSQFVAVRPKGGINAGFGDMAKEVEHGGRCDGEERPHYGRGRGARQGEIKGPEMSNDGPCGE